MRHFSSSRSPASLSSSLLLLTLATAVVTSAVGGCLPYAAGTTARTAPPDEIHVSAPSYVLPQGLALDSAVAATETNYLATDVVVRFGLSERSDIGIRGIGGGSILEYKRRVAGRRQTGSALALQGGAGVLNNGDHMYLQMGSIVSTAPTSTFSPYGGVRVMQIVPLSPSATTDVPTLGGFVGVRIGTVHLGVSPEVGLYYDKPAFDVEGRRVHIIPSITLHGSRLFRAFTRSP